MSKVKIINRSNWPDHFIDVLMPWVMKKSGLKHHEVTLPSVGPSMRNSNRADRYWRGLGGYGESKVSMSRRIRSSKPGMWPYSYADYRYKWAEKMSFRSRVELLIFLTAHEMHHSRPEGMRRWHKDRPKNVRATLMEDACNKHGWAVVLAWRIERRTLMGKLLRSLRAKRRAEKNKKARKALASKPEAKRVAASRLLAAWEKKHRLASTKVKKYRRKVKYYNKAMAA